jgi:hypothetical protein
MRDFPPKIIPQFMMELKYAQFIIFRAFRGINGLNVLLIKHAKLN